MKVRWRKIGKFSGPIITGDRYTPKYKPTVSSFWTRTLQLTAAVECYGRFGVVNLADSAVSAGLLHPIAFYPRGNKEDQGPLFKLLRTMNLIVDINRIGLGKLFRKAGFEFRMDGTLRYVDSKRRVDRETFQQEVVPPNGRVPRSGKHWFKACSYAEAFHSLFTIERTFRAQEIQAINTLKKISARPIRALHTGESMADLVLPMIAKGDLEQMSSTVGIGTDIELALAMYLNFSINAPRWAQDAFTDAFESIESPSRIYPMTKNASDFARALIKALTDQARKWDDDKKNSRYQRSRRVAMKMWPPELFEPNGIMPEDINE